MLTHIHTSAVFNTLTTAPPPLEVVDLDEEAEVDDLNGPTAADPDRIEADDSPAVPGVVHY